MQSICYFASKTWDLCNANGVKKVEHGIVRRKQAHFGQGRSPGFWLIQITLTQPQGMWFEKDQNIL